MSRMLLWFTGAGAFSAALSVILNQFTVLQAPLWWCSLLFLALLFLSLSAAYSRKNNARELAPALIAGFVVRFLAGLVFLLVFYLLQKGGFLYFALHFISHWLLFTLAEIVYLTSTYHRTPQ